MSAIPAASPPQGARPSGRAPPRARAGARGEAAVAEVLGTALLLGIAVAASAAFAVLVMSLPPPGDQPHTFVQAYILPTAPSTLVLEHRGGASVPLRSFTAIVTLNGTTFRTNVGSALAAGNASWAVLGPSGSKTANDSYAPGDQLRFTNASLPAATVSVALLDERLGALFLPQTLIKTAVPTPATLTAARTVSNNSIVVSFNGALQSIAPGDFTVTGGQIVTGASLLSDGTAAQLDLSPGFVSNATPTLATVAAPSGSFDLNGFPVQGNATAVAADGAPPLLLTGPAATAGITTAAVTWTTDEPANSLVTYGPTPSLGLGASVAGFVTGHSVNLSGLTPSTTYYYTVRSADPLGNAVTSGVFNLTTGAQGATVNPTFTTVQVNLDYVSNQDPNQATKLGLALLNALSSSITVSQVGFVSSPSLGSGNGTDAFFQTPVTTGPGSDAAFQGCTWAGAGTDGISCTLSPPLTIAPNGLAQLTVFFTSSKANGKSYTVLTGYADTLTPANGNFTSAKGIIQGASFQVDLFPLNSAGQEIDAYRGAVANQPMNITFLWNNIAGSLTSDTRFLIPAGWSNVSVPYQANLTGVSSQKTAISILQPTPTSFGYVDISQDQTTRSLYFYATPPPGLWVIEWSTVNSDANDYTTNNAWFGVSAT